MKQRKKQKQKQKDSVSGIFAALSIILACGVIITLIAGITSGFGTIGRQTPLPAVNRFTCPLFSETGFSVPTGNDDFGFVVCIDTDEDEVYYFTGQSGMQTFAKLNTSDPNNVFQEGPNLAVGNTLPGGIDTVTGCIYDSNRQEFIIADWTCSNLYTMSKNASSATLLSSSLPACIRGLNLVDNNTRLFGIASFDNRFFELDPTNGNVVESLSFQSDTLLGTTYFRALTFDDSTNEFYVTYFNDNDSQVTTTDFGRLNLNTSMIESTCVSNSFHAIGSIAIRGDGRYFMTSGKRDNFQLYTLSGAITPVNSTEAENWSLQCEADVANLTLGYPIEIENTFTVQGQACGTPQFFDGTDFPGGFEPIVAKRSDGETSYIMHPNQESASELVVEGINHIENIQPIIEIENTTQLKKRNVELPFFPFAEIEATPTTTSGNPEDYLQISSRGPLVTDAAFQAYRPTTSILSIVSTTSLSSLEISSSAPLNCQVVFARFHFFWWDGEADRWISVWMPTTRDRICLASSSTTDPLGAYSYWEFPFAGQQMDRMDFTIWGDYYLASWNDLNQPMATREANLFVFERSRILFGGGTPRVLSVPRHTIVATDGKRATAVPHRQPNNNGPRGPMNTAFPCGIWSVMSSGVINMRMCQSVNFDTSMVTTTESMTIIPAYNDGSTGNCTSEEACIPSGNPPLEYNPFRYEPRIAYRYFPNYGGIERFVIAITVDADGTNNAKILVGTFLHQTNGTLSVEREMFVPDLRIDSDFTEHNWNPSLELSPTNYLLLGTSGTFSTNSGIQIIAYYLHFAFDTQLRFLFPYSSGKRAADQNTEPDLPKRYIQSRQETQTEFAVSAASIEPLNRNFWIKPLAQTYKSKGIAIDDCNATATCFRQFTYNLRQSIPLPPSA